MRAFYLRRNEDVSGNSGCGRVAHVAEFDDGTAVLHWNLGANRSGVASTEIFSCISDLLRIHGHDGRSILEPFEIESSLAPRAIDLRTGWYGDLSQIYFPAKLAAISQRLADLFHRGRGRTLSNWPLRIMPRTKVYVSSYYLPEDAGAGAVDSLYENGRLRIEIPIKSPSQSKRVTVHSGSPSDVAS